MKNLFCFCAVATFAFFFSFAATAGDEIERQKVIIEILKAQNVMSQLDQVTAIVGQQVEAQLRSGSSGLSEEHIKVAGEVMREEFAEFHDEIIGFSSNFLLVNFTEEELRELLDFYKTPIGMKINSLLPKMTQDMMAFMPPVMADMQSNIRVKIEQRFRELETEDSDPS